MVDSGLGNDIDESGEPRHRGLCSPPQMARRMTRMSAGKKILVAVELHRSRSSSADVNGDGATEMDNTGPSCFSSLLSPTSPLTPLPSATTLVMPITLLS